MPDRLPLPHTPALSLDQCTVTARASGSWHPTPPPRSCSLHAAHASSLPPSPACPCLLVSPAALRADRRKSASTHALRRSRSRWPWAALASAWPLTRWTAAPSSTPTLPWAPSSACGPGPRSRTSPAASRCGGGAGRGVAVLCAQRQGGEGGARLQGGRARTLVCVCVRDGVDVRSKRTTPRGAGRNTAPCRHIEGKWLGGLGSARGWFFVGSRCWHSTRGTSHMSSAAINHAAAASKPEWPLRHDAGFCTLAVARTRQHAGCLGPAWVCCLPAPGAFCAFLRCHLHLPASFAPALASARGTALDAAASTRLALCSNVDPHGTYL